MSSHLLDSKVFLLKSFKIKLKFCIQINLTKNTDSEICQSITTFTDFHWKRQSIVCSAGKKNHFSQNCDTKKWTRYATHGVTKIIFCHVRQHKSISLFLPLRESLFISLCQMFLLFGVLTGSSPLDFDICEHLVFPSLDFILWKSIMWKETIIFG